MILVWVETAHFGGFIFVTSPEAPFLEHVTTSLSIFGAFLLQPRC